MSPKRREAVGSILLSLSIVPGLLVIFGGGFTFVDQLIGWLKTGRWTAHIIYEQLHLHLGFNYPHPSWWAARYIVDFLLGLPASATLILAGFVLAICGALIVSFPLYWLGLLTEPGEAAPVE